MFVLGIRIDNLKLEQIRVRAREFLSSGGQHKIFTPNPEMLVKAVGDAGFKLALNAADLNICDGFGLSLVSGAPRVPGSDFTVELCRLAAEAGESVYLLGSGSDETVRLAAVNLQKQIPGLAIAGFSRGPTVKEKNGELTVDEADNVKFLQTINQSGAGVLLVAFGMGKQEKWIGRYLSRTPAVKIAMGVGGTFDFISGQIARAPLFLRKIGLEWMYRLVRQPTRLRRIYNATFVFMFLVIKDFFKKKFGRGPVVRSRFAPSPTGFLHVGGLRTALYAYLAAKQTGGQFLLRIEDTDRERFVAGGTENILKSLYWAGIVPDEGVKLSDDGRIVQTGDCGPYIQSERLPVYQKYAQELVDKGNAYYCFCSGERLEQLRQKQQAEKQPTGYDGLCAHLDPKEAAKRVAAGAKHVIRMKMPKEGETAFHDLVRGEIRFDNRLLDDQVLIKSDGFPTYHLAVVVDDHLMKITRVVRGEEWISSTPKHLQLYRYFGWTPPQFAHLPLLLNADKSKLSKRQGDVAVEDYRRRGYLPSAVVNFVAFLGWNPGDEREVFSLSELVREFKMEKINKAGAVFNLEKLDWYNKEYLKKIDDVKLAELARPFLESDSAIAEIISAKKYGADYLAKIVALEKERVSTLAEIPAAVKFIFVLPEYPAAILVWKKSSAEEAKNNIVRLKELLNTFSVQTWNRDSLESKIGEWVKVNNLANGPVLWPLRVALSGQEKSPGPYEIAAVLGKDETLRRLEVALGKF